MRCCQGLGAALIPASLRGFPPRFLDGSDPQGAPAPDGEFHLHPHYRTQRPLDGLLLKTQAGLDDFVTEKYADQIGEILSGWRAEMVRSPLDVTALEKSFGAGFSGASLRAVESRIVRAGPPIEVRQSKFATMPRLSRDPFLRELRSALSIFTRIVTAEFQITSIDEGSMPSSADQARGSLRIRVRYELVGEGKDFHREQRVGQWEMEWEASSPGEFHLRSWHALDETISRAFSPIYLDVAAQAFGSNSSYHAQLLQGVDYWRTVLDGACGIDIYGHNGVSAGDIDNDNFDDLYVCQPAGLPNRLYRNRGDGTFEDITEVSGTGILDNTACALFADFENAGRQDLVVVRTTGPLLFVNEGNGKFRARPDAFKFAGAPQGTFTGAAVADYDRDGWLDIYFCLYVYYQGTDQYKYPTPYYDAENGPPNFMMRNNRDGTFSDVTAETGLNRNNTRYSFCCGWGDYNRDGWPDLYVVNDFGRKNLYRNNGDGTFTDVAAQAGVEDTGAGMSVGWLDYDNDGAEDVYVANMWTAAGERVSMQEIFKKDSPKKVREMFQKHAMGNSLFRNDPGRGKDYFEDTTDSAGVGMGRWAWASDAWDFDHDGFPDLYVANGMITGTSRNDLNSFFWRQVVALSPAEAKPSPDYEQGWNAINELIRADGTWSGFERNVFYANNRDGTFSDVSGAVGLDFVEDGRSFALADFDHDGRLEVFLKNRNGPQLRVLKNVVESLPPAISFHLRGKKSNRDAIGAAVTVQTSAGRQTRMLQAGSGFLSQHSKELFFGLGDAKGTVQASIRWPSGLVQELHDLPHDHTIFVEEGSATPRLEPFKALTTKHEGFHVTNPQTAEPLPTVVETWLLVPVAAPEFSLSDLSGQTYTLAALRGKPALLNVGSAESADWKEDLDTFLEHGQGWKAQGLQPITLIVDDDASAAKLSALLRGRSLSFPLLRCTDDVAAVYNILYRQMFDRHRDLALPASFLIDEAGEIVKIYRGPVNPERIAHDFRHIPRTDDERMAMALPFPGVADTFEFGRNYLSFGSVFFQRGYIDQSEVYFRQALRNDPSNAEALYGLGSIYLNQQKNAEARECFERLTKLQAAYPGTLPNAWNNLGLLAAKEGRSGEAIECFERALRLSPDHLIALENLGNVYRRQKNWPEARKVLERAVAVGPNDAEANYDLAMVFAQTDQADFARQYLQKAVKLRPTYPEALNNLGILYLRTQHRDEAVESFEECIRVAPDFEQSYMNLARVYAIENNSDKAREVLLALLKRHPENAPAQQALQQLTR